MNRDANCPSDAALADWLTGKLDDAEWESCSAHIENCPACQSALESIPAEKGTIAAELRREGAREPPVRDDLNPTLTFRSPGDTADTTEAPTWFRKRQKPNVADDSLVGTDFGQYRILEKIGAGGMGCVYRAVHIRLQKVVALKTLADAALQDAAAVERFEREMLAVGKLDHPNVVGALDAGEFNGTHFLVMEFIDGEDLAAFVQEHGTLSARSACKLVRQAAVGLQYAHGCGLVHRDIKPSNLMLTSGPGRRVIKVLDLGLARLQNYDDESGITSTGQVMGTVDYMAPEQAVNSQRADERSDIYSLGITLFYLLTGQSAYDGETPWEKLVAHREAPLPDFSQIRSSVPVHMQRLFERMAAKDPGDRYQSMTDVIQALDECLAKIKTARDGDSDDDLKDLGRSTGRGVADVPETMSPDEIRTVDTRRDSVSTDDTRRLPASESESASETADAAGWTTDRKKLIIGGGAAALLGLILWSAYSLPDWSGNEPVAPGETAVPGRDSAAIGPAGEPIVEVVSELRVRGVDDGFCWLTPDGLTLYQSRENSGFWRATRNDFTLPFVDATHVTDVKYMALTGDELFSVGVPARGHALGGFLCRASRLPDEPREFTFDRIESLHRQSRPQGPWLTSDGLTLVYWKDDLTGDFPGGPNRLRGNVEYEFAICQRQTREYDWSDPVRLPLEPNDEFVEPLTWPMISDDLLTLWFCHGFQQNEEIFMSTRPDADSAFGNYQKVVVNGQPLRGQAPRYVAATSELFFTSVAGESGDFDLWVVRNYRPFENRD